MTFISFERKITASSLLDNMKTFLKQAGWQEVDDFHKYVIVNDYNEKGFCYVIARHIIVVNSKGDYFGIAITNSGFHQQAVYIPSEQRLLNDDLEAIKVLDSIRSKKVDYYRIYLYQLDEYWKQLDINNRVHVVGYRKPKKEEEEEESDNENFGCGKEISIRGSVGVDVSNYYMGHVKKKIFINYNMYTVPDRIDVFYNGKLMVSTKDKGGNPGSDFSFVQKYIDHNDDTSDPYVDVSKKIKEGSGFVSFEGTLEFIYEPVEDNEEITVMTIGGDVVNTGWDYSIECEVIEDDEDNGDGGGGSEEEDNDIFLTCSDYEGMLLLALDLEHTVLGNTVINEYEGTDKYVVLSNTEFNGDFFQSPIVKVDTVNREYIDNNERFPDELNLWKDSLYRFDGCVDQITAFFLLEVDTAPMWEGNVASRIPIYMGGADLVGKTSSYNDACLFAGTAIQDSLQGSRYYDFTDTGIDVEFMLPLAKKEVYVNHPSNGITSAMLKRTKLGSWYQQHFICNFTPSIEFPIPKEGEYGEQYARAFQHYLTDSYKYKFNPSRYTERIHVSKPKIIHPELGVTAILRNIIIIQDLNIIDRDELVYLDSMNCLRNKENDGVYTYFKISSVSPLTKKPAIAFIPNAVGVRKVD